MTSKMPGFFFVSMSGGKQIPSRECHAPVNFT